MENKAIIYLNKVVIIYNDKEHVLTGFNTKYDDDWWGSIGSKDVNIVSGDVFGTHNECGWDVVLYDVKRESDGHLHCDTNNYEVLPTELSYRQYDDTQIYKEWNGEGENKATDKEWEAITNYLNNGDDYTFCKDDANGYYAISFHNHKQSEEECTLWGGNLVDILNELGEGDWYLGDITEDYVYVD